MKKALKFIGISLAAMFIILIIAGVAASDSETEKSESKEVAEVDEAPASDWSYSEDTDEMTNTRQYFANTGSTNELEFDFPYSGGSSFDLILRNNGEGAGNELLLAVDKGQFMPSIQGDAYVKMKFDDEEPVNYHFSSASDGSSNVIFLKNVPAIIAKLKTSKKLMIEAPFFQAGRQVIRFDTSGLEWPH